MTTYATTHDRTVFLEEKLDIQTIRLSSFATTSEAVGDGTRTSERTMLVKLR